MPGTLSATFRLTTLHDDQFAAGSKRRQKLSGRQQRIVSTQVSTVNFQSASQHQIKIMIRDGETIDGINAEERELRSFASRSGDMLCHGIATHNPDRLRIEKPREFAVAAPEIQNAFSGADLSRQK